MERAQELYDRIRGEADILRFITERESECLWLDFKRSKTNGAGNSLDNKDRQLLGEAISGFGNSEGGIIVWGVDCSPDRKAGDAADVARADPGLEDPAMFKAWLENAVSGCTVPPHSGVVHKTIARSAGGGFVVTLVPRSLRAPHQTTSRDYRIRVGASFEKVPHGVLAGMLGQWPRPELRVVNRLTTANRNGEREIELSWFVDLENDGPTLATEYFVTIRAMKAGSMCSFDIQNPGPQHSFFRESRDTQTPEWRASAVASVDHRLAPGSVKEALDLKVRLVEPFERDFQLEWACGARGAEMRRGNIVVGCDVVTRSVARAWEAMKRNDQRWREPFIDAWRKAIGA